MDSDFYLLSSEGERHEDRILHHESIGMCVWDKPLIFSSLNDIFLYLQNHFGEKYFLNTSIECTDYDKEATNIVVYYRTENPEALEKRENEINDLISLSGEEGVPYEDCRGGFSDTVEAFFVAEKIRLWKPSGSEKPVDANTFKCVTS